MSLQTRVKQAPKLAIWVFAPRDNFFINVNNAFVVLRKLGEDTDYAYITGFKTENI
jgi:hypothetical protein